MGRCPLSRDGFPTTRECRKGRGWVLILLGVGVWDLHVPEGLAMEDGDRAVPPFPSIRIPGAWGLGAPGRICRSERLPIACYAHSRG